jgi:hypothetical protein
MELWIDHEAKVESPSGQLHLRVVENVSSDRALDTEALSPVIARGRQRQHTRSYHLSWCTARGPPC